MDYEYVIWNFERGMWWNPREAGYTESLDRAGRYNAEDAGRICTSSIFVEDIPILVEVALRRGAPTIKSLWS